MTERLAAQQCQEDKRCPLVGLSVSVVARAGDRDPGVAGWVDGEAPVERRSTKTDVDTGASWLQMMPRRVSARAWVCLGGSAWGWGAGRLHPGRPGRPGPR